MSNTTTFTTAKKQYLKVLKQYVPIVDRVHGSNHPEFHDVRQTFDAMVQKIEQAGAKHPALQQEFALLRTITGNYTIPQDVCETYEAVYHMLSQLDEAYTKGAGDAEIHTR